MRDPWQTLLAPLPPDARPTRRPAVGDGVAASPAGAAVAGWSSLVLELSAGAAGLRVILVLLDAEGNLLSASDHVQYRTTDAAPGRSGNEPASGGGWVQESLGGRFETDGSFRGTRWHGTAPDVPDAEETEWNLVRAEPDAHEVDRLRALVSEVIRRA
jgi:hypothetical protein